MPPRDRYRQLVSPVGLDVINQDTGGTQAAQQLSDALSQFSRVGNEFLGQARAEEGAREGEAAGAAGLPTPRTGMRANTAYGRAYNSAAEAAYSSKMQTDIAAEFTKLEQDHEGDLAGFNEVSKGYAEKLIAEVPPEYRVRVEQAINARHAAGAARVREQQITFERAANMAAVMEGSAARMQLAVAAAMNLPRDEGDAAIAAAVEDNQLQLDALVADQPMLAPQAVRMQAEFIADLDAGLLATRTNEVVDGLMNEAKVDVLAGDRMLAQVLNDESIPANERAEIRKAYDAQRTALAEDRARIMVPESSALAQRLAADESGRAVDAESWRLYRRGGISAAEHEGNLRKSIENGKKKAEDGADVAAILNLMTQPDFKGLDPGDPKHRSALNKMVDQTVAASGMKPGDPRWTQFMIDTAKHTNILPASAESWARVRIMTGDHLDAAQGAGFLAAVQKENEVAWDYNNDPKLAAFTEQLIENQAAGIVSEKAHDLAYTNVYAMPEAQKEILRQEYGSKKEVLEGNTAALNDALSEDKNFDPGVFRSSPDATLAMRGDYARLVSQYYVSTGGNIETARNLAGKAIRSRYGVTEVNGTREIMKYAPERMYPQLSAAVIRDDMMKAVASVPSAPDVVDPAKIRLVMDPLRTERSRGLKWNILVLDEEGDHDVIRGADNKPLSYALPLGQDFSSTKERIKAEQLVEAARADEAARKRDPAYRALQREQLDDVQR